MNKTLIDIGVPLFYKLNLHLLFKYRCALITLTEIN